MSQPSPETLAVARLMRDALTTQILPHYGRLSDEDKRDHDYGGVATIADRQSEALLFAGLARIRPEAALVGEETVKLHPETLRGLNARESFTVDSLDGTARFAKESTGFGIIVSQRTGHSIHKGWILEAVKTADGWDSRVLAAERGKGIWSSDAASQPFTLLPPRSDAALIRVDGRPVGAFDPSLIVPEVRLPDVSRRNAAGQTSIAWTDKMWSAVSIYSGMVRGEIAAIVHGPTLPWDSAAALLMLEMRGGRATALDDGKPFRLERMAGGIVAGITPAFCVTARAETCRPVTQTAGIEPCIPKYRMDNPFDCMGSRPPAALPGWKPS